MKGYDSYFKGKRITVLGLGLLGKRIECIKFFSECGAHVLVTDFKNKAELAPAIKALKGYANITYRLGEHRLSDFENCDFVLKGQGTPLDSPYIAHARARGIPIEMDESLFMRLAPKDITVIGVTGTRGKTTTTMLIYHTLRKAGERRVFLGGNIKGTAVLPLLKTVRSGDTFVLELSSWQLQGFGEAGVSPDIAVFTNFMKDHLNYYKGSMNLYFKDKSYIFLNQKKDDVLVAGDDVYPLVKKHKPRAQLVRARASDIPDSWQLLIPGDHNRYNAACAYHALAAFGLKDSAIKKGFETFPGVSGRLSFVRTYHGVSIYNDTCATTPAALLAALKSFPGKYIVLLAGGTSKEIPLGDLSSQIKRHASELVLLPGTGTDKLAPDFKEYIIYQPASLKQAVTQALRLSTKGSILLFSPGFASFGLFKNEYDRGEQFEKIVRELK